MRASAFTRPSVRAMLAVAAVIGTLLFAADGASEGAHAAGPVTRTWTGAGANANWNNNANWNPGLPAAGDILVFPAAAARKANVNNFPAGTSFEGIRIEGGGYTLGGARLALTSELLADAPGGTNFVVLGIDGAGGLRNDAGTLYLMGANGYTGASFIQSGEVFAGSNSAFGAASGVVDILAGAITLGAGVNVSNKLIIGGPTEPTLRSNGNATWSGPISLVAFGAFDAPAGFTLTMSNQVSGSGRFHKTGAGRVSLTAANTYTGLTNVDEGVLRAGHPLALGGAALGTFIEPGAVLEVAAVDLGQENATISGHGIGFGGALVVPSGPASVPGLIVSGESSLNVQDGTLTLPQGISDGAGAGDLLKLGPGVVVIAGSGNFDQTLVVELGTVVLLGSFGGDVTVDGGMLTGDGQLQNLNAVSGVVEPGVDGDGVLTVLGDATLGGTSQFRASLEDQSTRSSLRVHGEITLAGASLGLAGAGSIPVGESVAIIENLGPGPIAGTFDDLPEGSAVSVDGKAFDLTYDDDGSVAITRSAANFEATDLGVAVLSLPPTTFAGAEVTVTYHGFNFGPAIAAEATIRIAVRDGVRVKEFDAPDGWSCEPPPGGVNGPLECTRSNWAPTGPNSPAVFTVIFTVTGEVGDGILFDAFAAYEGDDPNTDNDTAHRFVDIVGPDLLPFKLRVPFVSRDGVQ